MRALLILSVLALSITPALGMSTKEKVRLLLWVKGINDNPKSSTRVYTWPEEIEKPLRGF